MKAIAVHFAVEKPSVESSETIIDILYTRFAFHCVYVCVCVYALEAMTSGLENISTRKCHDEEDRAATRFTRDVYSSTSNVFLYEKIRVHEITQKRTFLFAL